MRFPGGSISFKLHPAVWAVLGAFAGAGVVAYFWRQDLVKRAQQARALEGSPPT